MNIWCRSFNMFFKIEDAVIVLLAFFNQSINPLFRFKKTITEERSAIQIGKNNL